MLYFWRPWHSYPFGFSNEYKNNVYNCCGPIKGLEEIHELEITWNKYIEWKYKYSIGKRVLNVSVTAKVLGWRELNTEMNILLVFIVTGRVHYSP